MRVANNIYINIEEISVNEIHEYVKVSEKQVDHFTYHYDSDENPASYAETFDMTNWGIFSPEWMGFLLVERLSFFMRARDVS